MKDKYIAVTQIHNKLPDGTYSKDWSKIFLLWDEDIQILKDAVSDELIRNTVGLDCCATILYEKNGEYYDSEEIFFEKGEIV